MSSAYDSTIAAVATPTGKGGVGIVRVSGALAKEIGLEITKREKFLARYAHYSEFYSLENKLIDKGLAIFFPSPNSFTGEDVLELHAHGGSIVLDMLLKFVTHLGADIAEPGEFSKRAYLNGKMDLLQAEAILDLINANTEQAAMAASATLVGDFSVEINNLLTMLINLRKYVEAAIDFPEEEVDFLADESIADNLNSLNEQIDKVFSKSKQGRLLQEGMSLALMGKPNAGKSSLLNFLSGRNSAIVTEIAGTTRDILQEQIAIDGMPLNLIDTAGLRESSDLVEKIGIERAVEAINKADCLLLLVDSQEITAENIQDNWPKILPKELQNKTILGLSKIDLTDFSPGVYEQDGETIVRFSVKTGAGVEDLLNKIKTMVGFNAEEGNFTARRRHIHALEKTLDHLAKAKSHLKNKMGELLAEELSLAQISLGKITGKFSADDLLGEIFSDFCIGK